MQRPGKGSGKDGGAAAAAAAAMDDDYAGDKTEADKQRRNRPTASGKGTGYNDEALDLRFDCWWLMAVNIILLGLAYYYFGREGGLAKFQAIFRKEHRQYSDKDLFRYDGDHPWQMQ